MTSRDSGTRTIADPRDLLDPTFVPPPPSPVFMFVTDHIVTPLSLSSSCACSLQVHGLLPNECDMAAEILGLIKFCVQAS